MRRVIAMVSSLILLAACDIEQNSPAAPVRVTEYGSIEGVVKLNDGGVASGIDIRLARVESGCMFCGPGTARYRDVDEAQADAAGVFEFPRVRTGWYVVLLGAYPGYSSGGLGYPASFPVTADRVSSVTRVLIATP